LGNPAAPYLNSLITPGNSNAAQVSYATAYYSAAMGEHPSEPNYIWSEAGEDFGSHTDNDPSLASGNLFSTTNHLCGQLNIAGISWKSYQEDLEYTSAASISSAGTLPSGTNMFNGSTEYYYAAKHNPMEFFTDTQNQNVYPFGQLWTDLASNAVGRYNWITPDEFNEMHSYLPNGFVYQGVQYFGNQAAIAEGDNCLSILIPEIMASAAYQDHGVIIIWTDETESTDDTNTALTEIIISSMAKGNAYASSVPMSHSSDLKTMEEIFGLAFAANGTPIGNPMVNDLSDMFQTPCNGPAIAWSFTNLTLNVGSNLFAAMIDVTGTNYILASDGCGGLTITQTPPSNTPLAAGTTNQVVIAVADSLGNTVYSTNWIVVPNVTAPVIVSQPTSTTTRVGMSVHFNVQAMGYAQMNYQWFFGTNALASETNSLLAIPSVSPTNAGSYRVVVTYAGASVASVAAVLTVVTLPPVGTGGPMTYGPGGFQWTFPGTVGQTYRVLASTSLAAPASAWTVVGSGTFGVTNAVFADTQATSYTARFYAIASP
jgi:hypothetical protein